MRQVPQAEARRFDVDERGAVDTVEPAHRKHRAFDRDKLHDGRDDGVRPHGRSQREGGGQDAPPARPLQDKVAPGLIHPVKKLERAVRLQSGQRLQPACVDMDLAVRSGNRVALTRAVARFGPGGTDPTDEPKADVERLGGLDRDFAGVDVGIGRADVQSLPTMTSVALTTA